MNNQMNSQNINMNNSNNIQNQMLNNMNNNNMQNQLVNNMNNNNMQNQLVNNMNINNNIQNQMLNSMNISNNVQNQMLHSMNISNNAQNQILNNMNNNNMPNQMSNIMNNNNIPNQMSNIMNNNNIPNQMSNIMNNNNISNQMSNIMNSNNMQNQMNNFMNSNIMQNPMSFMSQFYNQNMSMNPQVVNNKEKDDDIYKNDPEDIYPYIKEPKKEIILVTSDLKKKRILIPEFLSKNELYYTSTKFRRYKYSVMKLFHNTILLDDDDTSIEGISNGDIIKINEYLDVDTSFSETLLLKYKNSKRINITCTKTNGVKFAKSLPVDITVLDMIKAFVAAMGIPFKSFEGIFLYNGMDLTDKKNEILKDLFKGTASITYYSKDNLTGGDPFYNLKTGKILNFNIKFNDSNLKFTVGSLVQIKDFYKGLKDCIISCSLGIKIDKVILNPGNIEINKDDERTFSAIGIRKDFECKLN